MNKSWVKTFHIIEKFYDFERTRSENLASTEFRALSYRERFKINYNFIAILCFPFYYPVKGMWHKGAFLFGCLPFLNFAMDLLITFTNLLSDPFVSMVFPLALPILSGQLANLDYYLKITKGEKMWPGWPEFFSQPLGAIIFPLTTWAVYSIWFSRYML